MLRCVNIEFTNKCNLACPNCPSAYTTFPRGYITQETVELALKYLEPHKILHGNGMVWQLIGHGETLLHPKVLEFTELIVKSEKKPWVCLGTNGLLLTSDMIRNLFDIGIKDLHISLHVPESVDALIRAIDIFESSDTRSERLSSNYFVTNTVVSEYIDKIGARDYIQKYLSDTVYHTWAGSVKGTRVEYPPEVVQARMSGCWFLTQDICAMQWDGTITACCYDFNDVNHIGHISDLPNLKHTPETYELCKYCSPDMIK